MGTVFGDTSGERSIVVGGDAIRSILITGDHNQVFVGDYVLLRDAYIQPWSVFQRVDVKNFVGREWLTAEIDTFLATEDCGYFVLEAAAGVGKTAFLAHLVSERGYIHHFVELAPGSDGVAPALKNLAAQVVRAAELVPYSDEEVLPAAAGSRPDFFAHLLKRASDQRSGDRDKIVIVVDALDEAAAPIGHNVLGLPEVLPPGVFMVVSQRPVPVKLNAQVPPRVFSLDAHNQRNLEDMRHFLERAVASEQLAARLHGSDYGAPDLVEALLRRSAGVWIYLHYVLADLKRGEYAPLDLDVLPDGVWDYYARFWRRWREEHRDEWNHIHLPLLATLSVVQEDASADLLAALAGIPAGPELEALLDEHWLPFLAVSEGGERRYRPYHASLREFLDGRLDREGQRAMDLALARKLHESNRNAHERIANRYFEYWGGLEEGLPGLSDSLKRDLDDRYGLRHLAAHLIGAERSEELHRLLSIEWTSDEIKTHSATVVPAMSMLSRLFRRRPKSPKQIVRTYQVQITKNAWYTALEQAGATSSYLQDVQRAWKLAGAASLGELAANRPAASVGREIRYALLTASIGSLAEETPPLLISSLVALGRWTPDQAIAHVHQIPDESQRAAAIAAVAPHLPKPLLEEMFKWAQALPTESARATAIVGLSPYLSQASLEVALAAVRAIAYEPVKADALERLASHLPQAVQYQVRVEAAFIRANMIKEHHVNYRRELVAAIQQLAEPARSQVLHLALESIKTLDDLSRLWLLQAVAPLLPESLLEEALSIARTQNTADEDFRDDTRSSILAETITTLLPYLREPLSTQALGEALRAAYSIPEGPSKTLRLVALLPYLDESQRHVALSRAVTAAESRGKVILFGDTLEAALIVLLPHVAEPKRSQLRQEALTQTRAIYHPVYRAKALVALAPHLPDRAQTDAFKQIVAIMEKRRVWQVHDLIDMLEKVAPGLPEPYRSELIRRIYVDNYGHMFPSIVSRLPDDFVTEALTIDLMSDRSRVSVLAAVAPRLQGQEQQQVIEEALALPRELNDGYRRQEALAALAGYLPDEQLDEALTIARNVHDLMPRVEALAVLSRRLPSPQRVAVLNEALTAVIETQYEHEKAGALTALVPHLPEPLNRKAFNAVTELSGTKRSEALAAIAPHLPEPLLPEALTAARAVGHEYVDSESSRSLQAEALAGLLPYLPEPQASNVLREICATLAQHGSEPVPAAMLAAVREEIESGKSPDSSAVGNLAIVAPYLPEPLLGEALATARDLEWWRGKAIVTALAPRLAGPLLSEALKLARSYYSPESALARLAPYLPHPERSAVLTEALSGIFANSHFNRDTDVPTLKKLAKELSTLPRATLGHVWQQILPSLASQSRERLLIGITALAPVIAALGGASAVQEASRAIQDVGRWLP